MVVHIAGPVSEGRSASKNQEFCLLCYSSCLLEYSLFRYQDYPDPVDFSQSCEDLIECLGLGPPESVKSVLIQSYCMAVLISIVTVLLGVVYIYFVLFNSFYV